MQEFIYPNWKNGIHIFSRKNCAKHETNGIAAVRFSHRMMECVDMMNSGWLVSGFLNSLLLVWMKTYRCSDSRSL